MADDDYDLLPHQEIEEIKRQVQELKTRSDKSSSQGIVNALDQLTRSMDAMLKLFTEAAHEVKGDDKEHEQIADKLDEIIEQNKTIAEGMVAVSDMVRDFVEKQRPMPMQRPITRPNYPMPQPGFPGPRMQRPMQDADFPGTGFNPELDEPMQGPPRFNQPGSQGPVPMPSMPFSDFDLGGKPKKKGIFGRLKK